MLYHLNTTYGSQLELANPSSLEIGTDVRADDFPLVVVESPSGGMPQRTYPCQLPAFRACVSKVVCDYFVCNFVFLKLE
jgi:hypothetical protein